MLTRYVVGKTFWIPLFVFIVGIILAASVRTSSIVAITAGIFAFFIMGGAKGNRGVVGITIALFGFALLIGLMFYRYTASYGFNFSLSGSYSAELIDRLIVSDRSFTSLIYADAWWKNVLLLPLKMGIYILAPLPNITISISGLAHGNYSDWQGLLALLSVPIYCFASIAILAGYLTFRGKPKQCAAGIITTGVAVYVAVMLGTHIIHERYRVMAIPCLVVSALVGAMISTRKQMILSSLIFGFSIVTLGLIYIIYKYGV